MVRKHAGSTREPDLSRTVHIDQHAPVRSSAEIEIACPVSRVWKVLTEIPRWPEWNPEVREVTMDGPLSVGTVFRWKAGSKLVSQIVQVDENRCIAWSGTTMGIDAIHIYRFHQTGSTTKVSTEESFRGPVATLLKGFLQTMLDRTLRSGLVLLKQEAERRA